MSAGAYSRVSISWVTCFWITICVPHHDLKKTLTRDVVCACVCAMNRIRYLTNPSHRFKVRKNAQQHGLTGVLIFNPRFALVVAEGGSKGIRAYKHLMLHRIDWTEEPRARTPTGEEEEPKTEDGQEEVPVSLADNKCELVWEGEGRDRAFKSFRPKNCPSDAIAKEFLGSKLGFWFVVFS